MKKILLLILMIAVLSISLIGCGNAPEEPIDVPNGGEYVNRNGDNGETADYSHLIGTWQGYAIAVTQTVVITDVQDHEITFHFIHTSSMDGTQTDSPEFVERIVNNQVTVTEEREAHDGEMFEWTARLTFFDDRIELSMPEIGDDIAWRLEKIVLEGN